MNNTINFSISSMDFVDEAQNSLFREMKIKAFASGKNAHTLPIDEDVLKRGALTVYNKPILWKYNPFTDDANNHDIDEVPCGFVPETKDNKVIFEREPDGRLFMVIKALIWTRYCGKLMSIFKRDGGKKDVSVEIITNDDENNLNSKPKVLDFVIAGITILGEWIDPACKGSQAELIKFSIDDFDADKERYIKSLSFSNSNIKIDNTKESSVDGNWSNPRRKLFNPIINATNKNSLLKEAYLVHDKNFDTIMSNYKYPHHVIKNDKLVLHVRGLQAAFSRASQQGIVSGDVKEHLVRHYNELGLNKNNFSEFGLSEKDFTYFSDCIKDFGKAGENKMDDNEKMAKEEATMGCEGKKMAENQIEGKDAECSEKKMADSVKILDILENFIDKMKDKIEYEETDIHDESYFSNMLDKMSCKFESLAEDNEKLKEDNKAYMGKINEMSDYEDLKKFKCDTMEKQAREEEMSKMEKVMSDIENRGIQMSKEDKDKFISDIKKFSSIDAWSNYVKASIFDKAEKADGIVKMAYPDSNNEKKGNSIWDRI